MKIGIDIMGGDTPEDIVFAVKEFIKEQTKEEIVIFAKKGDINAKKLEGEKKVQIIYTKEEVLKEDDPAMVVRRKKDSSLVVGVQSLKDREIDAFISSGSTGALVAAGIFVLKRKGDISKPALPGFLPKKNKNTPTMLLDLGANIYTTSKNLLQYCDLAIEYMQKYYNIKNPSIKLLNIGEEENKGTDLQKEVYIELKKKEINFLGNIEARDVLNADCDIILMDGWTGNIMLKSIEGTLEFVGENIKEVFYKNLFNKVAALILKKDLKKMYSSLDYKELGATPVLGVDGLLLKAHGSSDKKAYLNAFKQAVIMKNMYK